MYLFGVAASGEARESEATERVRDCSDALQRQSNGPAHSLPSRYLRAAGNWLSWTLLAPAALTLLFQASTALTERISAEKYPA